MGNVGDFRDYDAGGYWFAPLLTPNSHDLVSGRPFDQVLVRAFINPRPLKGSTSKEWTIR